MIVLALLSLSCALLLQYVFTIGYYYILFTPLIIFLPICLLFPQFIYHSHCRNPALAIVLGLFLASIYYLGYYHIDMVKKVQGVSIFQVNLTYRWIEFRMKTDVKKSTNGRTTKSRKNNWPDFYFDSGILLLMIVFMGFPRTRLPYSERDKQWYKMAILTFDPGFGHIILSLLDNSEFEKLKSLPLKEIENPSETFTSVVIFYLPNIGQNTPYIAIKEVSMAGNRKVTYHNLYTNAIGSHALKPSTLNPTEFAFFKREFIDKGIGYGDVKKV